MDEVIALVQNAYKDKSLKNQLGTIVNIIATKEMYGGDLSGVNRDPDIPWQITFVYDFIMGYTT